MLLHVSAFLRELSKPIELAASCQGLIFRLSRTAQTRCWRALPRTNSIDRHGQIPFRLRTAQNIKQRPASLEPLGLTGRKSFLGLAMACSLRDSLQGLRACISLHLTLRTSFPLPSSGRPNGHREAPSLICNFQRVAHATLYCNSRLILRSPSRCDFLRIAIHQPQRNPQTCGKAPASVGKARNPS